MADEENVDVDMTVGVDVQHPLKVAFNEAASMDSKAALAAYKELFNNKEDSEVAHRIKELSLLKMGEVLAKMNNAEEIVSLLRGLRSYFTTIPKAKTAKIVRSLIDSVALVKGKLDLQQEIIEESINWCKEEKRTFLRQRLESKLAVVLLNAKKFAKALKLITALSKEVKRLDDKQLLVEIHLVESFIHQALRNIPKAKGALTAARAAAASIYVTPVLQAEIDHQAGTLQAADKDYKTAFSYFLEAFKSYSNLNDERAILSFKYLLLVKIMQGRTSDARAYLIGKYAIKYAGRELEAMKAVAKAYEDRSIHALDDALNNYPAELANDALIQHHLKDLNETLLEQNLIRLIEPYSRVEISHIASLIKLPVERVENKLSQLILDKKFSGILDQGLGHLVVFGVQEEDNTYKASLDTIASMNDVVDSLFRRAATLT